MKTITLYWDKVNSEVRELIYSLVACGMVIGVLYYAPYIVVLYALNFMFYLGMFTVVGYLTDWISSVFEPKRLDAKYGIPLHPNASGFRPQVV